MQWKAKDKQREDAANIEIKSLWGPLRIWGPRGSIPLSDQIFIVTEWPM